MKATTENRLPKSKKITNAILNFFLALSILIVALAAVWAIFFRSEDTFLFGYKPFIVASESMEPAIKKHAVVLIKKIDYDDINAGEVVAFKSSQMSGKVALHRVVDVTPDGILTKGDANRIVDEYPVTQDVYLGREIWHTNLTASLLEVLQTPRDIFLFIVLPLLFIITFVVLLVFIRKTARRKIKT